MKYLLDSVVLVDHLNGVRGATRFVTEAGGQSAISVVARAEVLTGATARNEDLTVALLDRFVTLPINIEVADAAAQLRRDHGWKLPDALQAATALVSGLTLVTRDRKLFRGDARLKVELPYRVTPQR